MKIVPKGWHIAINQIPFIHSTMGIVREITYTDSCRYHFGNDDDMDWNKSPIGFSIGLFPKKGVKPMHYNSIRFGWRYNPISDTISITPYWYVNGERHYAENSGIDTSDVSIGIPYIYYISRVNNGYLLSIRTKKGNLVNIWQIPMEVSKSWGWSACLYFGGSQKAPHTIKVKVKNL